MAQGDAILVKDLPPEIRGQAGDSPQGPALTLEAALDLVAERLGAPEGPPWTEIEREVVRRVLRAANGDEVAAAKRLGITRAALRKRL